MLVAFQPSPMSNKKAYKTLEVEDEKKEDPRDEDEEEESEYELGFDDDAVQEGLLLIGLSNSDKTQRDNQNQAINEVLKEATIALYPTGPRHIGAKKLRQAINATAERIQPLKWELQGDGATEEEEILVTKALKEALHRGDYDATFTGKGGMIDTLLRYGDGYRLIEQRDKKDTSFPVGFRKIDANNIFMTTNATTFRKGNKNITQLVALFKGTMREFDEEFPQFAGKVKPGLIPRNFSYKDLDQTTAQKYQTFSNEKDCQEIEWAYMFDMSKRTYRLIAGADLSILEAKGGTDCHGNPYPKKYSWTFKNLEGKEEAYIPVSNFMCRPGIEGIYNDGLGAYLYDMTIVFRMILNMLVGHVKENVYPHTLVNIPVGQEASFFNLIEMANQMRAAGQPAYVPLTFNPNNPGQVGSAQPILNGGDANGAQMLMNIIEDEFRKCGVYINGQLLGVTATEIEQYAADALALPKSIMKYNAPEVEFEVMVAIDMYKKYIKKGDETPLILDTTVELPDGEYSIRGIPFTLGWLKEKLMQRQWRVVVDPESGARVNETMLIGIYNKILPTLDPASSEYAAVSKRLALATGIELPKQNPAAQMLTAQAAQGSAAGQPVPQEGAAMPPTPPMPAGMPQ